MKPSRDHQMQHQPKIIFQTDADPLSHPAQLFDNFAFHAGNRRLRSPKQKRAGNTDVFERLPEDAPLESFDIYDDVGQFRHRTPRSFDTILLFAGISLLRLRPSRYRESHVVHGSTTATPVRATSPVFLVTRVKL